MITDEKRAELREKRAQRKAERRHRAITREARHWTGPERTGWNSLVPGGERIAQAAWETRRRYATAHPIPRPAARKPRAKRPTRGEPTNGIVGPVECNSAYARGEGRIGRIGRTVHRDAQRMSYTQAVQHGMVKEQ
jgi:hypothetical protein